jgi:hypothetical protein
MKLFEQEKPPVIQIGTIVRNGEPYTDGEFSKDTQALESHVSALCSVQLVQNQMAQENYSLINESNYVLYNEYIQLIGNNLGVKPQLITQESLSDLNPIRLNRQLALEGFIGTIWQKVKDLFNKIYEGVKKFFVGYFTRVGRLKKKLTNLQEVLSETDKDLQKVSIDNPSGSVVTCFPLSGSLSADTFTTALGVAQDMSSILTKIDKDATALANKEVLDKDFVTKIKNLRNASEANKDKAEDLENDKTKGIKKFYGKGKKNNKEIKENQESLSDLAKQQRKEADTEEGKALAIGDSPRNAGLDFDEGEFTAAKKEFGQFLASITEEFSKLKGKHIVKGKTITKITVNDDGIEFDIDTETDKPDLLSLDNKSGLGSLIKNSISVLTEMEKLTTNYSKINDTVMKNLEAVDKIIKDIDAIGDQKLGPYKNVLTKKVQERLRLMKNFFNNYNRFNKNLFEMTLDILEGNAEYAVVSLKYFG